MSVVGAGERAVALFNRGDAPAPITIVNSELLSGSFAVRDAGRTRSGAFLVLSPVVPRGRVVPADRQHRNTALAAINAGGPPGSFADDTNATMGANSPPISALVNHRSGTGRGIRRRAPVATGRRSSITGNLVVGGSYRVRRISPKLAEWRRAPAVHRINGTQVRAISMSRRRRLSGAQGGRPGIHDDGVAGFVSIDSARRRGSDDPRVEGSRRVCAPRSRCRIPRSATPFASSQWDGNYRLKATDGIQPRCAGTPPPARAAANGLKSISAPATFDKTVIKEAFNRITYYTTALQRLRMGRYHRRQAGANKADTFPAITASRVRLFVNTTVPDGGGNLPVSGN
jgi:hypothetical protein